MNDAELHAIRNLLARIHRDGGHYTEEHGPEKSIQDAEVVVVGWMEESSRLMTELDRVQKQAGEMRSALQICWEHINDLLDQDQLRPLKLDRSRAWKNVTKSHKALSSDAGQHYHHRDQINPLIEALEICKAESEILWHLNPTSDQLRRPVAKISDTSLRALSHSKEKGFIP